MALNYRQSELFIQSWLQMCHIDSMSGLYQTEPGERIEAPYRQYALPLIRVWPKQHSPRALKGAVFVTTTRENVGRRCLLRGYSCKTSLELPARDTGERLRIVVII